MISESYLTVSNRLPEMMTAIQNAGLPPRFTIEFLMSLGFKSTNDRPLITVLKGLGFLDASGVPTEIYRTYKNKSDAPKVLANAMRTAYEDVFLADENAQNAATEKLKGIFATKTGKGDSVTSKMAATFKALAALADFTEEPRTGTSQKVRNSSSAEAQETVPNRVGNALTSEFYYNIQIHLPVTKDITVYNAIFKSLREHLL